MSQLFEIIFPSKKSAIVIGKTYYGIDEFICEIEQELTLINFKGEILFDLLLSNGIHSANRFMHSNFDSIWELEPISAEFIPHKYKIRINDFYKSNINILNNGVLFNKDIDCFKKTLEVV